MLAYVAFLRGLNLGNRRIKNPELCAAFEALGMSEVSAFLASGNVMFVAPEQPVGRLTASLERGLAERLGYPVPTFLRTAARVRAIAEHEPFSAAALAVGGKPQVALLATRPSAAARERALALSTPEDLLALDDRELHWLPRAGVSDSELDFKALDRILGTMTVRTRNTIVRLAARMED